MNSKIIAVASMLSMASAFLPSTPLSAVAKSSSALKMNYEDEPGVIAPLGYWDPLGFSKGASEVTFRRNRIIEIKHGRIAQLAVLGYIVPEFVRLPGYLSLTENLKFSDVPNGVAALSTVPGLGIAQILIFQSVLELIFGQSADKAPGDIAPTDFWVRYSDPEIKKDKLTKELNNGRLAMMAITGMIAQNLATGQTPVQCILSGHISPFGDGQGAF